MSRWFRHYAGMMRDDKLVRAAVKAKQPVERVVWVWGAILESAAEINDGGRYDFDSGEAAYFLRCDDGDLDATIAALEEMGRIAGGVVCKWSDRQYDSDSSRERQKRYRDRHKPSLSGDSDVTQTSRDASVTLQETRDREQIQKEDANASFSSEPAKAAPVASSPIAIELPCVSGELFPISEADMTEWLEAFPAVDVRQQLAAMRSWLNANPTRRKTHRGMRRFAVSWLDKAQNRAPAPQRQATAPPRQPGVSAAAKRIMESEGNGSEGIFGDHGDAQRLPSTGGGGPRNAAPDLPGGIGRQFITINH